MFATVYIFKIRASLSLKLYQYPKCHFAEKFAKHMLKSNISYNGYPCHVKLPSHINCVFGVHIPPGTQAIVVFNVDLYPGLHSKSHVCPGYGAQLRKFKFGSSVGHRDTNRIKINIAIYLNLLTYNAWT